MKDSLYPTVDRPVGRAFKFDFGQFLVRFTFTSATEAGSKILSGAGMVADGYAKPVQIEIKGIRSNLVLRAANRSLPQPCTR